MLLQLELERSLVYSYHVHIEIPRAGCIVASKLEYQLASLLLLCHNYQPRSGRTEPKIELLHHERDFFDIGTLYFCLCSLVWIRFAFFTSSPPRFLMPEPPYDTINRIFYYERRLAIVWNLHKVTPQIWASAFPSSLLTWRSPSLSQWLPTNTTGRRVIGWLAVEGRRSLNWSISLYHLTMLVNDERSIIE